MLASITTRIRQSKQNQRDLLTKKLSILLTRSLQGMREARVHGKFVKLGKNCYTPFPPACFGQEHGC
jgi:hypothetical protein